MYHDVRTMAGLWDGLVCGEVSEDVETLAKKSYNHCAISLVLDNVLEDEKTHWIESYRLRLKIKPDCC